MLLKAKIHYTYMVNAKYARMKTQRPGPKFKDPSSKTQGFQFTLVLESWSLGFLDS